MWVIILLLVVGLTLIMLEAVLPYGVSATVGIACIVGSVYYAFVQFGPELGVVYLLLLAPTAGGILWIAVRIGKRTLSLGLPPESGAGPRPEALEPPPVGDLAEVVQPLRPTGTVRWNERNWPARSLRPERPIEIGRRVRVRGYDSVYILVEPA